MKKLTNKKGFTLMEMIIVVAIIAILAVITIPTLTANTTKAEKAADAANLHAAKAVYQVMKMESATNAGPAKDSVFDVATSTFLTTLPTGKTAENYACGQCEKHKNAYITVDEKGNVVWSNGVATCD